MIGNTFCLSFTHHMTLKQQQCIFKLFSQRLFIRESLACNKKKFGHSILRVLFMGPNFVETDEKVPFYKNPTSLVKVCFWMSGFDCFSNKLNCSVVSHNNIVLITGYALFHSKEYC